MTEDARTPTESSAELQAEIARLNKIIRALVNRAERSTEVQGSDFTLFETALMLDGQVRARTAELEAALRENQKVSGALRANALLFRAVAEAMVEGAVLQSSTGAITALNPAAERILGAARDRLVGRTWSELPWPTIHEDGSPFPAERHPALAVLRTGEPQLGVVMGVRKADDAVTWIAVNSHPLPNIDPATRESINDNAIVTTLHDVTEQKTKEAALRKSEAKFAAIFNLTPDPIALTRLSDGTIMEASRSFCAYFGLSADNAVGHTTLPGDLNIWLDAEDRRRWVDQLTRTGEVIGFETRMRSKDGTPTTVLISGKRVDIDGEPCVVADIHDITVQKQRAAHFEQIAYHDPLTGLPNRLLLGDRLQQAIAQSRRSGIQGAVCYLDLDGFKEVNDRFGHRAGDQLLIQIAERLAACVRAGDTVARLGGDEFVVLLAGLGDEAECFKALDRLLQAVSIPYRVGKGAQAEISASIGVTLFPQDAADAEVLVRHADQAMYAAKRSGKNQYRIFDLDLATSPFPFAR